MILVKIKYSVKGEYFCIFLNERLFFLQKIFNMDLKGYNLTKLYYYYYFFLKILRRYGLVKAFVNLGDFFFN